MRSTEAFNTSAQSSFLHFQITQTKWTRLFLSIVLLILLPSTVIPGDTARPILPPPTQLYCPTIGISAYILVTITPETNLDSFGLLLEFYAKLMPMNTTDQAKYDFYFGSNYSQIVKTNSLEDEVNTWVHDDAHIAMLYASALTNSSDKQQYDNGALSDVAKSILDLVSKENQQDTSVYIKKQVVLLTDYVPLNVTDVFNHNQNVNTQILGLYQSIKLAAFNNSVNFPVFSMEDSHITPMRRAFQEQWNFDFPPDVYEAKPQSDIFVFMTSTDTQALKQVVQVAVNGPTCQLPRGKMYSQFVHAQIIQNGTVWLLVLPWLSHQTEEFALNCLDHIDINPPAPNCTEMKSQVFWNFLDQISMSSNQTFAYLFIDDVGCMNAHNVTTDMKDSTHIRLVTKQALNDVYEDLTAPLTQLGFLDKSVDNQVIHNDLFYLTNHSTTCSDSIPMVSIIPATPWHRPKYLHIALDDMITIVICATISVSIFGVIIYRHVSRKHEQQLELLSELMLQPRIFKAPKECAKVARLPWEIKSENVYIDTEFLLGEGTISNVYLGKLKGKAPIMQWIDRVEMKQYQDCAVAVRVPRHFDEPEEDQLAREIASMRQLRHHDHIALLLGWTNKNDLVCSLLELTHMNLIKYLSQIKETIQRDGNPTTKEIPFQTMYKLIWETCDGIAYMHSRNLIHRDLTARNILLTTGLRSKISGFGFCSEPDDPKFSSPSSLALRYLPVRWLAPECFSGKFSFKSDSWAFGVLMYEIFTLGNVPYDDLLRPEEIIESVRRSRIPAHPKYASKQTYHVMQGCFQMFASRRPSFDQLKDAFHMQTSNYYHNEAFEPEDI